MNKLSVLSENVKTYFIKRLIEEVGESLSIHDPRESSGPFSEKILVRTTGVNRDDRDLAFLKALPLPSKIFNPLRSLEIFRSKNSQYDFFQKNHLPHLPWRDLSCGSVPEN